MAITFRFPYTTKTVKQNRTQIFFYGITVKNRGNSHIFNFDRSISIPGPVVPGGMKIDKVYSYLPTSRNFEVVAVFKNGKHKIIDKGIIIRYDYIPIRGWNYDNSYRLSSGLSVPYKLLRKLIDKLNKSTKTSNGKRNRSNVPKVSAG